MEMRYLLIRLGFFRFVMKGFSRRVIFIFTPEEESRVKEVLGRHLGDYCFVQSGTLSFKPGKRMRKLVHAFDFIRTVVVTQTPTHSSMLAEVLCKAHLKGVRVMDLEFALSQIDPCVPAHPTELTHYLAQRSTHQDWMMRAYAGFKRVIEPCFAFLLLVLLSPILLLVAIGIKLTSPGPVFYSQERVGYRSKVFQIHKFRSMRTDAEKDGPAWASAEKGDSRLTPIGGFLRATHLDEIPQLWNVLRGELSLIGPRPERPVFVRELEAHIPLFRLRSMIRPGVTGWAQVRAGYANSVEASRRKLELDLFYLNRHSPWLDAVILIKTFSLLLSGGTEARKRRLRFLRPGKVAALDPITWRVTKVLGASERPVLSGL